MASADHFTGFFAVRVGDAASNKPVFFQTSLRVPGNVRVKSHGDWQAHAVDCCSIQIIVLRYSPTTLAYLYD